MAWKVCVNHYLLIYATLALRVVLISLWSSSGGNRIPAKYHFMPFPLLLSNLWSRFLFHYITFFGWKSLGSGCTPKEECCVIDFSVFFYFDNLTINSLSEIQRWNLSILFKVIIKSTRSLLYLLLQTKRLLGGTWLKVNVLTRLKHIPN